MKKKYKPILKRKHPCENGTQDIYRFKNGYGASVVFFRGSYGYEAGLLELAVLKFESKDPLDFHLVYDTIITNDVIGWLTPADVEKLLKKIERLK